MKTVIEQTVETVDAVVSAFTHLTARVEELRRRYTTIPDGVPRKTILKIQLDSAEERLASKVPDVVLLCYKLGLEADRISARLRLDIQTVQDVLAKHPDQRRVTMLTGGSNEVVV